MASIAPPSLENLDTQDQTHLLWEDLQWPYPLDEHSVMVYFERSPFFDVNSTNMIARREGKDPTQPGVLEGYPPGLEFVVSLAQAPNLFVIRRQVRRAGGIVTPLAFYYILDKKVYQAPTIQGVFNIRLQRCLWHMQQAFGKLQRDLDPVAVLLRKGDSAQADPEAMAARDKEAARKPIPVVKKMSQQEWDRVRRSDNMIINILQQIPPPKLPPSYFQSNPQQTLGADAQHIEQTALTGLEQSAEAEVEVNGKLTSAAVSDGPLEPSAKRQRV